mmetsp:Transcript_292/g.946  ORF Transcript_292/g.946 Transcript_292/m.946 type:complete len:236 (+) Transcript_292:3-710(+)
MTPCSSSRGALPSLRPPRRASCRPCSMPRRIDRSPRDPSQPQDPSSGEWACSCHLQHPQSRTRCPKTDSSASTRNSLSSSSPPGVSKGSWTTCQANTWKAWPKDSSPWARSSNLSSRKLQPRVLSSLTSVTRLSWRRRNECASSLRKPSLLLPKLPATRRSSKTRQRPALKTHLLLTPPLRAAPLNQRQTHCTTLPGSPNQESSRNLLSTSSALRRRRWCRRERACSARSGWRRH